MSASFYTDTGKCATAVSGKTSIRQNCFTVVYLIGRFHDHLDVEVLRSHGQQFVVVIPDIPGVARDALKLLEGGRLLGLAWSGWRRLVACFDQTEGQREKHHDGEKKKIKGMGAEGERRKENMRKENVR